MKSPESGRVDDPNRAPGPGEPSIRSARLFGHAHPVQGAVAAVAEGPVAITLSRGGARKRYAHTDPNEDAAGFALGPYGVLVAVADGHYGARGAELAIEWLLTERASAWTGRPRLEASADAWSEAGAAVLRAIHRALRQQADELGVAPAPTTLSLGLVRPREGLLLHASVGDSHVFLASRDATGGHVARDLGWASTGRRRCYFAGEAYEGDALEHDHFVIDREPLRGASALVLASDGLSEIRIGVEDPAAAVAEAVAQGFDLEPEHRPLETGRRVTETALAAHRANRSGDNVCTATVWLGDLPDGELSDE